MSWNSKIGIPQWHPCYMEPLMDEHEVCECEFCHSGGNHDEVWKWKDACAICEKENIQIGHENGEHDRPLLHYRNCVRCLDAVHNAALHATYEFRFSVADVKAAQAWANANHYRYDDVNHLLHDAMTAGAIEPRGWKAA